MKALLVILTVVMLGTVAWLLAYEKPPEASQTCVGQKGTCCMSRGASADRNMTCQTGCDKPGTVVPMCQTCGGAKGAGCTCPAKSVDKAVTTKAATVTEHAVAETEVGKDVVCPVLGTTFKVTAGSPALEYKGQVHYFCCAGCPRKFKADPDKYLTAN